MLFGFFKMKSIFFTPKTLLVPCAKWWSWSFVVEDKAFPEATEAAAWCRLSSLWWSGFVTSIIIWKLKRHTRRCQESLLQRRLSPIFISAFSFDLHLQDYLGSQLQKLLVFVLLFVLIAVFPCNDMFRCTAFVFLLRFLRTFSFQFWFLTFEHISLLVDSSSAMAQMH